MTNILLSFRHTKYSKIKVTVRPEQKRHLICPEIAWSVRIEHIVWFTWTDHAFTPNRWSVLFEAIACFPLLPFTLKHPWIKGCEGGMQIFILLLHYTLLTSDRKESRFATNIKKGGCVKTLAQPHLYFKFCYIFFWLCYFFLMHLATSCYIPIISGYK